jgi:hypothetical protein
MRRVKETEVWKGWKRNIGGRREGGKVMKGIKERKKEGEELRCKRIDSLLNFSRHFILVS